MGAPLAPWAWQGHAWPWTWQPCLSAGCRLPRHLRPPLLLAVLLPLPLAKALRKPLPPLTELPSFVS